MIKILAIVSVFIVGCGGAVVEKTTLEPEKKALISKKTLIRQHRAFNHFSKGSIYEINGNLEKAADEYALFLEQAPDRFADIERRMNEVAADPDQLGDLEKAVEKLREKGGEYGATTGRPRRCGWFDAVVARHSVALNGCTGIALTKIDVLDDFETIKVCTAYELDGLRRDTLPASAAAVERCRPVYEEMPGWQVDTSEARDWADLPEKARDYLARLEELAGCRISMVSVGRERSAVIMRDE